MSKTSHHVIPAPNGGWNVRKGGSDRASKHFENKKEAEDWARQVLERYPAEIVVIGLGAQGALLAVRRDDFVGRFSAYHLRPVVSSIGAGDALFACFVHSYVAFSDPYRALKCAQLFAAYKIGVAGAAQGFLEAAALQALYNQHQAEMGSK